MTTDPVTLARDLMRHTLHGSPPISTTMAIAEALVKADSDLAALRIEHKAHAALLDITRRDRDEARQEVAALRDPENRHRTLLEWRGVSVPCATCQGSGRRGYANTSTWRGGPGGQMMTDDVCDACWGTGDAERQGVDLRELTRLGASLHKATAKGREMERSDVVAWLRGHAADMVKVNQHDNVRIRGASYGNAANVIERGDHEGAAEKA